MRAATAAGTPCSSRNSRTARSAPWSSHERTAAPIRAGPMPGTSRRARSGSRSIGGQDVLRAVALEQPLRPARTDVLDRAQVGEQRRLAGGLLDAGALGHEAPAVARMALPAALDGDRLALVDVVERADEHDLLALLADPGQHREGAVGRPPAHGGHLDAERALFGVEGLHQAKVAPGAAG